MTVSTAARRIVFIAGVSLFAIAFAAGAWQMLALWGAPRIGLDHFALAKRAQQRGDLAAAAAEYEAALRVFPSDAYGRRRLERVRAEAARPAIPPPAEATPDALAEAERAAAESPGDARAHLRQGHLLYRLRRFGEAVAAYERALALDPRAADAHLGIGLCRGKDDQPAAAEAAFRRAIEIDPAMALAHNGLGVVFLRQGRHAEARSEFERALAIDPALDTARANLQGMPAGTPR